MPPSSGRRATITNVFSPGFALVHTADLGAARTAAVRALMRRAFGDRFDDADWDHAIGGLHALVTDGGAVVAHASVVQRAMLHRDTPVRVGYVEAVAVDPAHRGRGHAATVLGAVERVITGAYDLGGLAAADDVAGLYTRRGWHRWRGHPAVLAPGGLTLTPDDDDSTYVYGCADPTGILACDWRAGDVW
jgi:aminoglycoside 2'-N-acetyltransferase I